MLPRSGDVLHITSAASVQFSTPILFRMIRVHAWPTYEGWVWLDGYEMNAGGDAVVRRSIFVQIAGIRQLGRAPDPRARNARTTAVTRTSPRPAPGNPPAGVAPRTMATRRA